jgi:hypothetical protein
MYMQVERTTVTQQGDTRKSLKASDSAHLILATIINTEIYFILDFLSHANMAR